MHDLPLDSLAHFHERVRAVKPEDVRAFAASHFSPDAMSVIVAGRAKEFTKPMRELFPKLEIVAQSELDLDSATLRRAGKR